VSRTLGSPARRPQEPLLVVEDLRVHFSAGKRRIRAVDGVSFELQRGETLGIVGESGSGKSVLARSIMGLIADEGPIQEGSVCFDGRELIGMKKRARRRIWGASMAMVFQDPLTSLNPVMKIGKQVTESIRAHQKVSRSAATDMAVDLLHSVRVPEPQRRLGQYPDELSGGMRQRVAIAIALSCSPQLLIADEPTTALDVTIQAEILELLQELQQSRGMSLVLISHDLGVVAGRTDRVAVMYGGRIVEHGPTEEVFENARMPYTEALLGAIPRLELPSHTRLQAIVGRPPDPTRQRIGCSFAPRCPRAQDKCRQDSPVLIGDDNPEHEYACWYPLNASEDDAEPPPESPPPPEADTDATTTRRDPESFLSRASGA
jgi:peptide/nickel transport system ATP-binding protein